MGKHALFIPEGITLWVCSNVNNFWHQYGSMLKVLTICLSPGWLCNLYFSGVLPAFYLVSGEVPVSVHTPP